MTKIKFAIALFLGLLVVPSLAAAKESFGRLTVQEVAKRRSEKGFYVFDNNTPETFSTGHVPARSGSTRAKSRRTICRKIKRRPSFFIARTSSARRAMKALLPP